jgi:hypothetical protein
MSSTPENPTDQAPQLPQLQQVYTPLASERGDTFADPAAFGHFQRVAAMLAASQMVPERFQGRERIPDLMIALDFARRRGLSPVMVAQNMYIVKGQPGWSATIVGALAQLAGWDYDFEVREIGEPIKYRRKTKEGTVDSAMPNLGVRCILTRADGAKKRGMEITSAQAIAARWADNEQYVHSAELMLSNRALTWAVRKYAPNAVMGLMTDDEIREIQVVQAEVVDVTPSQPAPTGRGMAGLAAALDAQGPQSAQPSPSTSVLHAGEAVAKPPPLEGTEARAAALHRAITLPISEDAARGKLREVAHMSQIRESAWAEVVRHGEARGWWVRRDGSLLAPEARPSPSAEIVVPDPWDGPTGEELAATCKADLNELGIEDAKRCLDRAGVPAVDGAPEAALRRLLVATTEALEQRGGSAT